MLRAFIVDDEPLARDELAYLLRRSKQVDIVAQAENIEAALETLQNVDIDAIFLDIQLGDESGIEMANQLNELEYPPIIVFATAYDEYALKAFELNAADYLLKPFDESRVQHTVEKLIKMVSSHEPAIPLAPKNYPHFPDRAEKLAITVDEKIVLVKIDDILYIEANEGKTTITTKKQKYAGTESLIAFERRLQNFSFIRVHRSFLVNLNFIEELEPWFNSTYNLIMANGEKVPLSRTYIKELKQLLGL